ncbi:hypothetical protein [Streptomyces liangshanensis]|uniref:Uncharacterized protein n=1 Tax=Streptomyces liangshanensis TaxID=2717324 RepID=A0A6G9GU02_9ACTN|nr:hypothetical protein [Streptomyces liangshanensis]QIQ01539.1 hypothetical protein HA039_03835 [Streptomyces liangshanensis]
MLMKRTITSGTLIMMVMGGLAITAGTADAAPSTTRGAVTAARDAGTEGGASTNAAGPWTVEPTIYYSYFDCLQTASIIQQSAADNGRLIETKCPTVLVSPNRWMVYWRNIGTTTPPCRVCGREIGGEDTGEVTLVGRHEIHGA